MPSHTLTPTFLFETANTARFPHQKQERKPEVFASTQDEVLFHCTKPSAVREAHFKFTVLLTSDRHNEKLPEVTVTS